MSGARKPDDRGRGHPFLEVREAEALLEGLVVDAALVAHAAGDELRRQPGDLA